MHLPVCCKQQTPLQKRVPHWKERRSGKELRGPIQLHRNLHKHTINVAFSNFPHIVASDERVRFGLPHFRPAALHKLSITPYPTPSTDFDPGTETTKADI